MSTLDGNIAQNICRACLASKDNLELQDLFVAESKKATRNRNTFSVMFSAVSTVKCEKNDSLPDKICTSCLRNLSIAYEFQEMCIRSDIHLRRSLFPSTIAAIESELDFEMEPKPFDNTQGEEDSAHKATLSQNLKNEDENEMTSMLFVDVKCILKLENSDDEEDNKQGNSEEGESTQQKKSSGASRKHKNLHKCCVCERVLENALALVDHLNEHNEEDKPFQCKTCNQKFSKEFHLQRHRSLVHSEIVEKKDAPVNELITSFKCHICDEEFDQPSKLASHMKKIHHTTGSSSAALSCNICTKKFRYLSGLTRHLEIHSKQKQRQKRKQERESKSHVCNVCKQVFKDAPSLTNHICGQKLVVKKSFLCTQCGKVCSNRSNFGQHMFRHTGLKPHKCPHCSDYFATRGEVRSHSAVHTKLKPHICDFCGSKFVMRSSLTKHRRIHTGEKPYPCNYCEMRFISSCRAKYHMRVSHTGEPNVRKKDRRPETNADSQL